MNYIDTFSQLVVDMISPLFRVLALKFCENLKETNSRNFQKNVKSAIIRHVKDEIREYAIDIPFLYYNIDNMKDNELIFTGNRREFLLSRGIFKIILSKSKVISGSLMPIKSGFIIIINKYLNINRGITSLAHEVGHTFFYTNSKERPKLIFNSNLLVDEYISRQFEGLAFDIGRELILPEEIFIKYLHQKNYIKPSLQNFLNICDDFNLNISRDIIGRRIFHDLKLWDAYLFWGTVKGETLYVKDKNKFRIRFGGKFSSLNLKRELLDNNSLKTAISKEISEFEGEYNYKIYFNDIKMKCRLEAIPLNKREKDEIDFIAMLY